MTKRNKITAKPDFSNWTLPAAKLMTKWFNKGLSDIIYFALQEKLHINWLLDEDTDCVEITLPFGDVSENHYVKWRLNIKKDLRHEIQSYQTSNGYTEETLEFFKEQEARFTRYAKMFADVCKKEAR